MARRASQFPLFLTTSFNVATIDTVGREAFQKEVETMVGRRLVGEPRGRPRKATVVPPENVL